AEDQRDDHGPAGEAAAHQPQGGERTEGRRERHGEHSDDEAGHRGVRPLRVGEELAYQRVSRPGGGNDRTVAEVNEMITTTTVGATRNRPTSPTKEALSGRERLIGAAPRSRALRRARRSGCRRRSRRRSPRAGSPRARWPAQSRAAPWSG